MNRPGGSLQFSPGTRHSGKFKHQGAVPDVPNARGKSKRGPLSSPRFATTHSCGPSTPLKRNLPCDLCSRAVLHAIYASAWLSFVAGRAPTAKQRNERQAAANDMRQFPHVLSANRRRRCFNVGRANSVGLKPVIRDSLSRSSRRVPSALAAARCQSRRAACDRSPAWRPLARRR